MKWNETRGLQAFRRVDAWFADHPQVIANAGASATSLSAQVAALQQVIARMTTQATEQATQASQATLAAKDEDTLRRDVRSLHIKAIVNVAGALRGKVPGVGVFKLPARRLSAESLLHAADAVRTTAAVYKDVFVEHGLPADFLEQLDASMTALKASVDARGVARSRQVGAGASLSSDLVLGKEIIVMIDAALSHVLKSDQATLVSWRQAKRPTVKGAVARESAVSAPVVATPVTPVASNVMANGAAATGGAIGGTAASGLGTGGGGEVTGVVPAVNTGVTQENKAA